MPAYRTRATDKTGRIHCATLTAAHETELAQTLRASGLELIDARLHRPSLFRPAPPAPALRDRAVLCGQIEDLLRAGVPFLSALHDIAASAPTSPLRPTLDSLARDLGHGSSLAAAFGQHPRLFNPVFRAVLAAGEASGDLTTTFAQLTRQLHAQARFTDQLRRALRYPLFLMAVVFGVTTFMMTMVVPQIVGFLQSISGDLPFFTRLLIATSNAFAAGWWIALLAFGLGGATLAALRRHSTKIRFVTDSLLLQIPGLGPTLRKLALARFTQCFAVLLHSGVDLPTSLHTAATVLDNRALIAQAEDAERKIQEGHPLSAATQNLFPPLLTQRLRVGERTGSLVKTLDAITETYEKEARDAVDNFLGTLEPALTLLIGALLAWVVLAVLGPLYSSLGKLNQVP